MTARTVTGNTILLTGSAQASQTVTFVKRYATISGVVITQSGSTTTTTDSSGNFSKALDCPASGSTSWTLVTPDGSEFDFTLPYGDGTSVAVTTLISAPTVDADAVTLLLDSYVLKSGSTMTGQLNFSGSTHAGIKLLSLTTAQRDALTPANGMVIYNSTTATGQVYQGGSWVSVGAAVDVTALTTTTGNVAEMLNVAAGGGLQYRTVAQVLSDLRDSGALATPDIGVLVASIGANTFTGAQNLADQLLTRPVIKDYGETVNAIGSTGGGTQDIDLTLGNVVSATVDTSANTFTFSNPSASGTSCSFTLILTNGGSQTVNWPASVDWAGATAPTLTAAGVDILTFTTIDGGTIWYGFLAGANMS